MTPGTAFVVFRPSGRGKAQCPPNPNFPSGIAIDGSDPGKPACLFTLPYPAPECGCWEVRCQTCGMSLAITAAGRPDDPVSVRVSCLEGRTAS